MGFAGRTRSIGIVVSGLVLRNSLGAESLAWTAMFLLLPLCCVYYPVDILPNWLQWISLSLPPTYVFEGMRAALIEATFRTDLMLLAFAINIVLLAVSIGLFFKLFDSARRAGSLPQSGE